MDIRTGAVWLSPREPERGTPEAVARGFVRQLPWTSDRKPGKDILKITVNLPKNYKTINNRGYLTDQGLLILVNLTLMCEYTLKPHGNITARVRKGPEKRTGVDRSGPVYRATLNF